MISPGNKLKFIFEYANAKLLVLHILLDLGVDEPSVEVFYYKCDAPIVWAIHCTGHAYDEKVFQCITECEGREATRQEVLRRSHEAST